MNLYDSCTAKSLLKERMLEVPLPGKPEACQQISNSERSDWTAHKKLLETYGLGTNDSEAATLNFLSRLSAQSVSNDLALQHMSQQPEDRHQDLFVSRIDEDLPSLGLPEASLIHNIDGNTMRASTSSELRQTIAQEPMTKQKSDGFDRSSSGASEAGLAVLAAATARFAAFDSIIDTIRAACSTSDGQNKAQSASAIRQRARRFENSSFCLNPKSKKIRH